MRISDWSSDVCSSDLGPLTSAEAFEKVFAFDNEDYVRSKGFSVTANLFCRRADFEIVGPFRTELSEDKEWCHRAIAKGFSIGYAAAAVVAHTPRRNWQRADELRVGTECGSTGKSRG